MKDLQQLVKGGAALMAVVRCSCQPVSNGTSLRNKQVKTPVVAGANGPPRQRTHAQEAPQGQEMWVTELPTGRFAKRRHDVVARNVRAFGVAMRPMESC